MERPPAARRGRLPDKWICRYNAGIELDRLTGDVFIPAAHPPQRCPSHKSPNQPSRMSPIYFTSRFVVLGAASLSTLDGYIESLRDTSCRLLPFSSPDAGSMVYWESLPFYGVISFILLSPREGYSNASRDPASGISIQVWSPRKNREGQEKRKRVIRQRNHVSRLTRSNLEIQGEFRAGFFAPVIPHTRTRSFAFFVAPKSLKKRHKAKHY